MPLNPLNKLIILLFCLIASPSYGQEQYRDYDRYKAVSTCMLKVYVERYQHEPAEENLFPLCEQRYLTLHNTLPFEEFIQYKLSPAHAESADQRTGNRYYDTLYGVPTSP